MITTKLMKATAAKASVFGLFSVIKIYTATPPARAATAVLVPEYPIDINRKAVLAANNEKRAILNLDVTMITILTTVITDMRIPKAVGSVKVENLRKPPPTSEAYNATILGSELI